MAIATELDLSVFTVFDADGNTSRPDHRTKHERDNSALITLLDASHPPFPDYDVIESNYAIWKTNLGDAVKADFGESYNRLTELARQSYAQERGIEKHDLFIAEWLTTGRTEGLTSPTLQKLCNAILDYARAL